MNGHVEYPAATVDFRYITNGRERSDTDHWITHSKEKSLENRFIWVSGDHNELNNLIRSYLRSVKMVERHGEFSLDVLLVNNKIISDDFFKQYLGAKFIREYSLIKNEMEVILKGINYKDSSASFKILFDSTEHLLTNLKNL